jgi:hypothetical protein
MTALPQGRAYLATMLAVDGLTTGAEVGVERGHFSLQLCQANPSLRLICVDAWAPYPGYREHVTAEKLEGFYQETRARLAPYHPTYLREFSVDAARRVRDGALDFVYLDGNHSFDQVTADLAAWTPKVRVGGIVAGHDYGRSSVGQVKEAVDQWTAAHGIDEWFVLTGDRSPSWFWVQQ